MQHRIQVQPIDRQRIIASGKGNAGAQGLACRSSAGAEGSYRSGTNR